MGCTSQAFVTGLTATADEAHISLPERPGKLKSLRLASWISPREDGQAINSFRMKHFAPRSDPVAAA